MWDVSESSGMFHIPDLSTVREDLACERRPISGCRLCGGDKRQLEIGLRSQASEDYAYNCFAAV